MRKIYLLVGVAACSLVATSVWAALPTDAATAVSTISTFATDILAAAWPILTTLAVGFFGMKLFKKAMGKAT